jgi:dephospho-CoA kinase
MTKTIGITGVIGSGKSTVGRLLQQCGARVINTDKLTHEVYKPGTAAWKEIVDTFGKRVLTQEGKIDRGVLGEIVFNDKSALSELNSITHPRVLRKVMNLIEKYRRQNVPVVVIEVPLLIEAGWDKFVDNIWVVTASKSAVECRLKKQRGFCEADIVSRTNTRLSEAELIKHAKVIIRNDGNRQVLKNQVVEQWNKLTNDQD